MKREIKNQLIKVDFKKNVDSIIQDFASVFFMNQKQMEDIANDENQPVIKRKLIEYIVSEDPKVSMDAIKYIHSIVNTDKLDVDIEIQSESINLTDVQEKIYNKVKKDLPNSKMISEGDEHLLKLYVINLERYNRANIFIERKGIKTRFGSGHEQVRPEITIMNNALIQVQKLSNMLGLNTFAKMKMNLDEFKESYDPTDEL